MPQPGPLARRIARLSLGACLAALAGCSARSPAASRPAFSAPSISAGPEGPEGPEGERDRPGEVAGVPLSRLRCRLAPPVDEQPHLLCPGMLPVLVTTGNQRSLVYRMQGPAHFVGGRRAQGAPFAGAVVAFVAFPSDNARDARLGRAMERAVEQAASRPDGGARAALGLDPRASTRVEVRVGEVRVGVAAPVDGEPDALERRAGARLELRSKGPSGERLRGRWVEARVTARARGEGPPAVMASAEAMIEPLSAALAGAISAELPSLLVEAFEDEARSALSRSRRPRPARGFETVEALAFAAAGDRLGEALRGGDAATSGAGEGRAVIEAPAGEGCVLAAAVAEPLGAKVRMSTERSTHADERGARHAVIEVCPGEAGVETRGGLPITIQAEGASRVRWAIYRSSPFEAR